jgi:hypothetical protein
MPWQKVGQCKTYPEGEHLIRGIAASEGFIYEITWLCPAITLTNLHQLRKIRGIQKQKEKRLTRSLP